MNILYKISTVVSNQIALIVLAVAAVGLLLPETFTWIPTTAINWLLGIVMFGMGLTLKPQDFKVVFTKPKAVMIGCVAQFTIMPLLAWTLCLVFNLPTEIAIGVILVGCCPGGTASNVITYLAGGDIALSVGMTGMSTLAAPVMTPLLTYLLAGEEVDVNILAMLMSVVQVVILPIILGFVANHYFGKYTQKAVGVLPMVSTLAIALIVGVIMGMNAERVLTSGLLIIAVVMLHNILGFSLGFTISKILRLDTPKRNAIAIEIGMQNSGLATSLAATHFAMYPLATIPGALFSVWHNFSGAIAANILRTKQNE
ncbi:MAG: bile acid:sodium symporter family protein [Bacteroidaceae bacterium]|nr:bile acid:sodium symporter family protein [Bacteroidaceae bacterium]